MRNALLPRIISIVSFAVLVALFVPCVPQHISPRVKAASRTAAAQEPASNPCGTIKFGASVPGDQFLLNQTNADCFAWSEFIPLNWPASGSNFGARGINPVQWEGYMTQETLYPTDGSAPSSAARLSVLPSNCQTLRAMAAERRTGLRLLRSSSKFSSVNNGDNFNFPQASPSNAPAWLGAQNGTNVWYEVLVNPDEVSYVTDPSHKFYNATNQQSWVNNGQGQPIVLTKGVQNGVVGTIELKAAWMEIPNYSSNNPKWQQYLLANAIVVGPANTQCRSTVVGLVGFHIIHKTTNQPTWVWATFEHVDNVPGPNNTSNCCNFNSATCQSQTVQVNQASCLPNGQAPGKVTVGCTANVSPPYNLGPGCPVPVPIQVTRTTGLDSTAQQINSAMWQTIKASYPTSVFQYYQLVDVLWATNPTQDPTKPVKVPLNPAGLTSGNPGRVANSVLETYVQSSQCTDCHRYANIAPQTPPPAPVWDADFSFALSSASAAPNQATKAKSKTTNKH